MTFDTIDMMNNASVNQEDRGNNMLYTVSNAAAKMSHSSSGQPLVIQRGGSVYGANLPLITELVNDTNVQFLDDDDEDDMVTYQIPFLIVFRPPLTDGRSGRWHPIVTI